MRRQDFHFDLPAELVAQEPLAERTASRLMVLEGRSGNIGHSYFSALTDWVNPEDLLVFNNTRVIPARLYGIKQTGGRVEILIERVVDDHTVVAHIRASKTPQDGSAIIITADAQADASELTVRVQQREGGLYRLISETDTWRLIMRSFGHVPLPPYIDRDDAKMDWQRYQTVYACREGAVAAPTAGLHFDQSLLSDLTAQGVATVEVTLHVGSGTFQPVRVEDVTTHQMHSEWLEVTDEVVSAVTACRQRRGRVIAVGTTSVRALETAAAGGQLAPFTGESDIFLYPGKQFRVIDAMITNFHLPESTLIMLVSAFAGYDNTMAAYREAVRARYRFFSYGDAMFVTPAGDARLD
ncbi:MAG: tRNA preQ1(34) S-adenosylmethionine ribosyltransferase-isomerase QueA [Cellvibrionales bacterium]|jgi:S-adenosylmethionine:tRNA ribosyltransferase-isomerase